MRNLTILSYDFSAMIFASVKFKKGVSADAYMSHDTKNNLCCPHHIRAVHLW
jgi:hypothetical protein